MGRTISFSITPKEYLKFPQDHKLTMTQTFAAMENQKKIAKLSGLGLVFLFHAFFFFSSFLIQLIDFLKKVIINGCKVGVKPILKGMDSSSNACPSPISLSLGKIFIKHRQKDKRQDKIPIIPDPYQH